MKYHQKEKNLAILRLANSHLILTTKDGSSINVNDASIGNLETARAGDASKDHEGRIVGTYQ